LHDSFEVVVVDTDSFESAIVDNDCFKSTVVNKGRMLTMTALNPQLLLEAAKLS
jgi:hypothetical protein